MIRSTLVAIVLALSLTASADAAKPKLRVLQGIVAPPLPAATKLMSPDQFARWAVEENLAALTDSFARNAAIKAGKPAPRERHAVVSESKNTIKRRFGGGVGYGGFGGNGGYAGYNPQGNIGGVGGGMGGSGNLGGSPVYNYNYGYGFNNPGNASQESDGMSSITYDMTYRDPETWDGGAVTVINPFCQPK